jgi:rhomboid protease GluP
MKFANKQIEELPLTNLTVPQFLTLAIETSKSLGWVFGNITTAGFIAYTNNGFSLWNAEIRLRIENGLAILQSESRGDDVKDVRENKKNLQSFISTFDRLKRSLVYEAPVSGYEKLKSNFCLN